VSLKRNLCEQERDIDTLCSSSHRPTLLVRSRDSSVGMATFDSRQWQETDRLVLGFAGVKAAERESDESSSFSARVKHEWLGT